MLKRCNVSGNAPVRHCPYVINHRGIYRNLAVLRKLIEESLSLSLTKIWNLEILCDIERRVTGRFRSGAEGSTGKDAVDRIEAIILFVVSKGPKKLISDIVTCYVQLVQLVDKENVVTILPGGCSKSGEEVATRLQRSQLNIRKTILKNFTKRFPELAWTLVVDEGFEGDTC